jgi:hypothetical protein
MKKRRIATTRHNARHCQKNLTHVITYCARKPTCMIITVTTSSSPRLLKHKTATSITCSSINNQQQWFKQNKTPNGPTSGPRRTEDGPRPNLRQGEGTVSFSTEDHCSLLPTKASNFRKGVCCERKEDAESAVILFY